ncbi:hypothetical protein TSPI_10604 [Trichinella spiralis]|uniref:Piwi domain-containing protein n=1 Tax=Trichinella spiralis TaxID=6334 RepID=A0ABR3KPU9_TRISP
MSQQSQDTNLAADELSQLGLKELVKRPGYGTVGKPIKLACNYFPLIKLQKGDIVVNRYHIDIQHPRLKLNCDDNRDVFWAYVVKRSDIFGDPFKLAYDGKSTLFTVEKLHLKQVGETADPEKFSFKTVRENKPSELSILMQFTGLVHLDFRNAEAGSLDEREKGPIQFLDILFAQGRSSPLFELSKSFKAVRNSFYCIPQEHLNLLIPELKALSSGKLSKIQQEIESVSNDFYNSICFDRRSYSNSKVFGVQIKAEPMIVSGRVLPPPRLEYGKGNGGRQIILTPKDGAWNSNEFKFFESASCESFGFVSFLPPHKASMLQEFCLQIVRTCRSTGIEMPDSPKFYEQARKNDTVEMVLKRIADKCDRDGIKCDLVFVALFSSEQYAQVKSCGDITFGLVTQCVLPKTISDVAIKKSYSTMLNIAMKINMKIGGINTKLLEDEILDNYLYKNNALVIGVDVVHPSAVETHLPSIASVVGNVDTKVTKFHASVKLQPAKQELITGFIEQFSERLLEYLDVNVIMEFKELVDRRDIICARSVSIPAPVYFADLVCARARYHVLAALNSGLVKSILMKTMYLKLETPLAGSHLNYQEALLMHMARAQFSTVDAALKVCENHCSKLRDSFGDVSFGTWL